MKRASIFGFGRILLFASSVVIPLFLVGCENASKQSEASLSAGDARAIAKEAYIYGFPMVVNYQTMYKQAIDKSSPDYRGALNSLNSSKSVATPEDKFVVTPNSDTPYSYLWMDLRAEPIVITMPKIEPNRYYTAHQGGSPLRNTVCLCAFPDAAF
jgi:hypothetical protein